MRNVVPKLDPPEQVADEPLASRGSRTVSYENGPFVVDLPSNSGEFSQISTVIYQSIYLSIHLSIDQSIYLYIYIYTVYVYDIC